MVMVADEYRTADPMEFYEVVHINLLNTWR
jgi:hypothetical protein